MREKIDLLSSALFSILFVLALLEMALRLAGVIHQVPVLHKELLLMSFLLWFLALITRRDSGDDWAGQL